MLPRLWGYLFSRPVMRDADRLIRAHGEGAYGMALIGARAAREGEGDGQGHWSAVASEIARRTGKLVSRVNPNADETRRAVP